MILGWKDMDLVLGYSVAVSEVGRIRQTEESIMFAQLLTVLGLCRILVLKISHFIVFCHVCCPVCRFV